MKWGQMFGSRTTDLLLSDLLSVCSLFIFTGQTRSCRFVPSWNVLCLSFNGFLLDFLLYVLLPCSRETRPRDSGHFVRVTFNYCLSASSFLWQRSGFRTLFVSGFSMADGNWPDSVWEKLNMRTLVSLKMFVNFRCTRNENPISWKFRLEKKWRRMKFGTVLWKFQENTGDTNQPWLNQSLYVRLS